VALVLLLVPEEITGRRTPMIRLTMITGPIAGPRAVERDDDIGLKRGCVLARFACSARAPNRRQNHPKGWRWGDEIH
jgi:hypothetical protein